MPATQTAFPGELATPDLIKALASEYREAAHHLRVRGRRGEPLSWAPFRLSAIQAIELYLGAYLLEHGYSAAQIRALHHDLGRRSAAAIAAGLHLRKRTADHLEQLSLQREYLATRYAPELATAATQINRLTATLDEVAKKAAPFNAT